MASRGEPTHKQMVLRIKRQIEAVQLLIHDEEFKAFVGCTKTKAELNEIEHALISQRETLLEETPVG